MTPEELLAAIAAEQAKRAAGGKVPALGKQPIKAGHVPKVVASLRGGGPPPLDASGYVASHKYGDYGFDPTGSQGMQDLSLEDALQFYNNMNDLGSEATTEAAMGGQPGRFFHPADTETRRFAGQELPPSVKRKKGAPLLEEFTTPLGGDAPPDLSAMSPEELEAYKQQLLQGRQ